VTTEFIGNQQCDRRNKRFNTANTKTHYCQCHPLSILTTYLLSSNLNVIFPSPSWSSKWAFSKRLTPQSKLLEKYIFIKLIKKFSAFYRAQRFITVFTKACYLSLS
jgi:hypothetical protein